jgi:hypothetical protein
MAVVAMNHLINCGLLAQRFFSYRVQNPAIGHLSIIIYHFLKYMT